MSSEYDLPLAEIIRHLGHQYSAICRILTRAAEKVKRGKNVPDFPQKKIAKQLGVDSATLARWERGESRPSKGMMDILNRCLKTLSQFRI